MSEIDITLTKCDNGYTLTVNTFEIILSDALIKAAKRNTLKNSIYLLEYVVKFMNKEYQVYLMTDTKERIKDKLEELF